MTPLRRQVEEAQAALDRRWGFGQAVNIIDGDLRDRFARQVGKWAAAVSSSVEADIETHGQAMLRACAVVDAACVAKHGEPHDRTDERQDVAVCRLTSGDVIHVVRDHEEANRLARDGSLAFTFDELALCAEKCPGWPVLLEAKRVFGRRGNALVLEAERPKGDDWYERGGDDVPF